MRGEVLSVIELYLGVGILLLVALIIVLAAARKRPQAVNAQRHLAAQQSFFRQRQQELKADFNTGLIDASQLEELEQELKRQLVNETDQRPDFEGLQSKQRSLYVLLLLIPLLAILLYQLLGYQEDLALRQMQQEIVEAPQLSPELLEEFEQRLQSALAKRPDSPDHLSMMASLRRQAGDFAGAAPYYQRLLELFPNDAELMAQLAQARYLANNRQLDGDMRQLLKQALAIAPRQATALGVLGIDAFAKGDYLTAIDYWQRLLPGLAAGSSEQAVIQQGLATAKERAQAAGELSGLSVNVAVDPDLGATPDGVLFVVAKSDDGNPMPVAAVRRGVNQSSWPVSVFITDADVIRQGKTLKDFANLVITAHISLNGTAIRQHGDWIAAPQTTETGEDKALTLLINQQLEK